MINRMGIGGSVDQVNQVDRGIRGLEDRGIHRGKNDD